MEGNSGTFNVYRYILCELFRARFEVPKGKGLQLVVIRIRALVILPFKQVSEQVNSIRSLSSSVLIR